MTINVLFAYDDMSAFRMVNFIPRIGETVHIKFANSEMQTLKVFSVAHSDMFSNVEFNDVKMPMSVIIRLVKGKK